LTGNNGKPIGKGNRKVIEKVEYKGEYRIVGTVWSGKNKVGYAIIDIKTFALKLFTAVQTVELLKRYKFENAELTGIEIKNTECSMDRLLKFDTNQNVIGNLGITILGKVYGDKDIVLGFRAMDSSGKVVDISEKDIITISKRTPNGLLNAKQVPNPSGEPFVSAIKGNFKRIDKVSVEETVEIKNLSQERAVFMKEQHSIYLKRNLYKLFHELIHYGGIKPFKSKDKKLAIKRISKEFILPMYPTLRDAKDSPAEDIVTAALVLYVANNEDSVKQLGKDIKLIPPNNVNNIVFRHYGMDKNKYNIIDANILKIVADLDKTGDAITYFKHRNDILEGKMYKVEEDAYNIKHPTLLRLVLSLRNTRYHANQKKLVTGRNKDGFNPININYKDTDGIHELGYTVDRMQVASEFDSIIYGKKPLRWIFKGLNLSPQEEEFLLNNINCFGDVEILREIQKQRQSHHTDGQWLKGLLFLLAMHNPEVAKFANRSVILDSSFDLDSISKENFYLTEEDVLFYESGTKFNQNVYLPKGSSWSLFNLNEMPQATYEAISIHLANGSEVPFPRKAFENVRYSR
jgi:hypothetical protein